FPVQIYKQEVLHIEPIYTKGRRAKGIVVTKVKDIRETSKKRNQTETIITNTISTVSNTLISSNISTTLQSVSSKNLSNPQFTSQIISSTINEERPTKRTRHIKISEEIEILTPYLANTNPTDNDTNLVLTSLLQISNHWTKKK
ncbi:382_t:CDS:1, partial [Dentiscutata erythropus]